MDDDGDGGGSGGGLGGGSGEGRVLDDRCPLPSS
jgi:hypothetical protein